MWNKESLLKSETLTVKVCGDDVVIRKLKAGEVFGSYSASEEDRTLRMISDSLVEPLICLEDAKQLPLDFVNALSVEISKFNGIDGNTKPGN